MRTIKIIFPLIIFVVTAFSQQWEILPSFGYNYRIGNFDFVNAANGFLAIKNGSNVTIYKTVNNGINWTSIKNVTINSSHSDLVIEFINPNLGFIYHDNKIERSVNGGTSWQDVFTISSPHLSLRPAIKFLNESTGYATCTYSDDPYKSYIYRTTNGGSSWELKHTIDHNTYKITMNSIAVTNTKVFIVGTATYKFDENLTTQWCAESTNEGTTFYDYPQGEQGYRYSYDYVEPIPGTDENFRVIGTESNNPQSTDGTFGYKIDNGNRTSTLIAQDMVDREYLGGLSFSDNNTGYTIVQNKVYKTSNSGTNWFLDYTLLGANESYYCYNIISSFGDVVYCGSWHGDLSVRKIGMYLKTYYDGFELSTSNAFKLNDIWKNTTTFEYLRGGDLLLQTDRYKNYNNYPYLLYGWSDNTNFIDENNLSHYYIHIGDVAAYYKGKMKSTISNALGNPSQTKSTKDTTIGAVTATHVIHESMGGIFYSKSTDNGENFQNEEVVNYCPIVNDADGNKNATLTVMRYSGNFLPITYFDQERNVAAVWERYNSVTGKNEIKVAHRKTNIYPPYGYTWARYGTYGETYNFKEFTASSNFESKPRIFVAALPNSLQNSADFVIVVPHIEPYGSQTKLVATAKYQNQELNVEIDNGNITDFAVTCPYNSYGMFGLHFAYMKNGRLYYKYWDVGLNGAYLFDYAYPYLNQDLSNLDVLQNRGEPDITLRDANNGTGGKNIQPVVTFKGQYTVRIIISDPADGSPIQQNITYYPVVVRERSEYGLWATQNFQYNSTNYQQSPNIEGSKNRNSYIINFKNGASTYHQKVVKWENYFGSGYNCNPCAYNGTDAKFVRSGLFNQYPQTQKLLKLSNSSSPYELGIQSFDITTNLCKRDDITDEVNGTVINDNIKYSFNLGSIMVNSQMISFDEDIDTTIGGGEELNENLKSKPFLLNNNDTLVIGRNAFYVDEGGGDFTEVQYAVYLNYNSTGESFLELARDTVHAGDSIQVEYLEGFIIPNIPFGSDSFYVQMRIDTVWTEGGDGFGLK